MTITNLWKSKSEKTNVSLVKDSYHGQGDGFGIKSARTSISKAKKGNLEGTECGVQSENLKTTKNVEKSPFKPSITKHRQVLNNFNEDTKQLLEETLKDDSDEDFKSTSQLKGLAKLSKKSINDNSLLTSHEAKFDHSKDNPVNIQFNSGCGTTKDTAMPSVSTTTTKKICLDKDITSQKPPTCSSESLAQKPMATVLPQRSV